MSHLNSKSQLQELLQKSREKAPKYETQTTKQGFKSIVSFTLNGQEYQSEGVGTSMKEAEKNAAELALLQIKLPNPSMNKSHESVVQTADLDPDTQKIIIINGDTTKLTQGQLNSKQNNLKIYCSNLILDGPQIEHKNFTTKKALDYYLVSVIQELLTLSKCHQQKVQIYLISGKLNTVYQDVFEGKPVTILAKLPDGLI